MLDTRAGVQARRPLKGRVELAFCFMIGYLPFLRIVRSASPPVKSPAKLPRRHPTVDFRAHYTSPANSDANEKNKEPVNCFGEEAGFSIGCRLTPSCAPGSNRSCLRFLTEAEVGVDQRLVADAAEYGAGAVVCAIHVDSHPVALVDAVNPGTRP